MANIDDLLLACLLQDSVDDSGLIVLDEMVEAVVPIDWAAV
jgi:hypothetical protein